MILILTVLPFTAPFKTIDLDSGGATTLAPLRGDARGQAAFSDPDLEWVRARPRLSTGTLTMPLAIPVALSQTGNATLAIPVALANPADTRCLVLRV